jgi:tyrosine-specific transport protein
MDFLKDGLKLPRLGRKTYDALILSVVLVPPLLFSLIYPHVFLQALGFAGGFVDVLLFGILPVAIVWIGRYKKQIEGPYRFPGGKLALLCIGLFSLACLTLKL